MKFFEEPVVEVIHMVAEDIILQSPGQVGNDGEFGSGEWES